MSTQINLRFDDGTVAALDDLAAEEGRSRADVVRDAVERRLAEVEGNRAEAAYRAAYTERPETPDELDRARRNGLRLIEEEPWERWW